MDTSLRSSISNTVSSTVNHMPISRSHPGNPAGGNPGIQSGKPLPVVGADSGAAAAELRKQQAAEADKAKAVDIEDTLAAVHKINEALREKDRELEFSVDEGSGLTVVKVIHSESGEVIRQLPPEVVLKFAEAFTEGSASLLEDFA